MQHLNFIAALSENFVIGHGNTLPWYLPEDLGRFAALTKGKSVWMGGATFKSLGKPLPNRRNYVVGRPDESHKKFGDDIIHIPCFLDSVFTQSDYFEECLRDAFETRSEEIFIIGGEKIFQQAFSFKYFPRKLYLTLVKGIFDGDKFFPFPDFKAKIELCSEWMTSRINGLKYRYLVLEEDFQSSARHSVEEIVKMAFL